MEAPAELGVAAVLVGTARVIAHVQLVTTLGHGWDAHVELWYNIVYNECKLGFLKLLFIFIKLIIWS